MARQKTGIRVGDVGFGQVNGYPPTHWRFEGVRNGSCILAHVKHASQSVAYPDQGVDWDTVRRIMSNK
jgi:hypothetical protein